MKRKLYTGGTFDLFHYGHVQFLERCALICNTVIVSLNTDEFIEEYKGRKPIMNYEERKLSLMLCPWVSDVVENTGGADSKPTIMEVMPSIIAIGSDWAKKDYYHQMQFNQDWLDYHNISLVYIPYTQQISTSSLISRIHRQ